MYLSSLATNEIRRRLVTSGLFLQTGEYVVKIQSQLETVANGISLMYAEYPLPLDDYFADFHVCISPPQNLRRFLRRQVTFRAETVAPFKPLPLSQAYPIFEWGLNWCVTSQINNKLIIHAAVVEKNGQALIMPGSPGSGKSTLCAALVSRGWRLLSDELTLISLKDGMIHPLPRPISLKNESIKVIKKFNPSAIMSPIVADTSKGTVAHMRAPADSVQRANESVLPAWLIYPKFIAESEMTLETLSKGRSLLALLDNAFNYSSLRERGFQAATRLIDQCSCFTFEYSQLDEAISLFDSLAFERISGNADK